MKFGVGIVSNQPLPKVVAQVKLAEELGYESAWLIDSQLTCRELYVTLTACALATSTIKLAAGVTAPHTRHPSVTASAFASLNEIAEGRLILGVSIGNTLVRTIGVRPAKVRELEGYVGTVRGLLDNHTVQFEGGVEGKITWLEGPTGIPIYVAASGPRLTRAAGRMADGVLLHYGALPHRIREGIELVRAGAEDAERSLSQVDLNAWVITSVSRDGDLARDHVRGRVAVMLGMIDLGRFSEEEREAIGRIREGSDFSQVTSSDSGPGPPELDGFIDMFTLAGTPREVGAKVQALSAVSELSQIVITLPVSGGRFPSVESIMRDFAEGVMGV